MVRLGRPRSYLNAFSSPGFLLVSRPPVTCTSQLWQTSWVPSPLRTLRVSPVRKQCAQESGAIISATNNRDWDKFQSKASESLQKTGRFLQTSTGQAVLWGGLIWLVLTGRIGWIFDSFLYLLLFFSVVPIIGVLFLRWWLNRQLVQGTCPSCGSAVTGLKNQAFQCVNCGQVVRGENQGDFSVNDPTSATIDIDAKRVD